MLHIPLCLQWCPAPNNLTDLNGSKKRNGESHDHMKTDLPVNDQHPDETIDTFDGKLLPSKDLPILLSQLKEDDSAQLCSQFRSSS